MGEHPAAAGGREPDDQLLGGQSIEESAERRKIGNRVHPAGPAAEVSLGLLAPQKQFTQDGQLLLADAEPVIGEMPVAGQLAAPEDLG